MTATSYKIGDIVGYVDREPPVDLTPAPGCRWYVVQTEPNREMAAQAGLVLRKVPFYMPTMLRTAPLPRARHLAGETHEDVMRPLFPGLLFVAESVVSNRYDVIARCPGVSSRPLWRFGEDVAVVRPVAMQAIQYIEAGERELFYRDKGRKIAGYQPAVGDEVRILLSAITDNMTGRVSDVDEKGRITILVELLKREVRVQATVNQIAPV